MMQRGFTFLSGFTLGSLIGGVLGLLLAPASGDEVRQQMQTRMQQIQLEVKTAAASRRAELEQELAALREPRKN
jgi:gas vesicle protein